MAWSYWEHGGVGAWPESYPLAKGKRQSPIDIAQWEDDKSLAPTSVSVSYNSNDLISICNNGKSWQINVCDKGKSHMTAKHLDKNPFKLLQIHAHWGQTSQDGSEHRIKGRSYAAEVHLVHWNTKYANAKEAVDRPDGLAVLGILLEEVPTESAPFEPLVKLLEKIQYSDDKCDKEVCEINLEKWLPNNRAFFTYEGSLTTPPCSESVLWTVFKEPMPISAGQMKRMRSLHYGKRSSAQHCPLVNNVRPVQFVGNRKVRFSAG